MTDFHILLRTSTSEIPTLSRFKVQVYFTLFKLIQYKMAYRISRLTNNEKYIQVVDMCSVTKVAEAFVFIYLKPEKGNPFGRSLNV